MPDERQQAVRELVTEWMRRARSDLALANLIEVEEISPEILAFHAQQAVEKALKALLVQRQVDFPRTHNIGMLFILCAESGYEVEDYLREADKLSDYAVAARYPGEMTEVSREEAKITADVANKIFDWAKNQVEEQ